MSDGVSERIRAHVAIVVGCLSPLDPDERLLVLDQAGAQLVALEGDIVPEPDYMTDTEQYERLAPENEEQIEALRAEIAALEAEHKERIKDPKVAPEQHLESALKISNLRAELRELERSR